MLEREAAVTVCRRNRLPPPGKVHGFEAAGNRVTCGIEHPPPYDWPWQHRQVQLCGIRRRLESQIRGSDRLEAFLVEEDPAAALNALHAKNAPRIGRDLLRINGTEDPDRHPGDRLVRNRVRYGARNRTGLGDEPLSEANPSCELHAVDTSMCSRPRRAI